MPVIREKSSSESLFSNFKKSEDEKSSDEDSIHLVFENDDRDESFSLDLDDNNKSSSSEKKDSQIEPTGKCNENGKEGDSDKENEIEKISNGISLVNGSNKDIPQDILNEEGETNKNCDNNDKSDNSKEQNSITSDDKDKENEKDSPDKVIENVSSKSGEVENSNNESDGDKTEEMLTEEDVAKSSDIEGDVKKEEISIEESKAEDHETDPTSGDHDKEINEVKSEDIKKEEDSEDDKKTVSSCVSEEELITFPKLSDKSAEPSENEEERYGSPKPEEDVMDISIIRDVDEDNAKFSASNEKLSSDNEDQDDSDEKNSNEGEDENSSTEKENDIQMDCVEEESGIQGDQEREEQSASSETGDLVIDIKNSEISNSELPNDNATETNSVQTKEKEDSMEESVTEEVGKSTKRLLPDDEEISNDSTKRLKLSETDIRDKIEKEIEKDVKVLQSFMNYMQNKKLYEKISRGDLEQFILEKCVEVIVYKTHPGEIRQRQMKQDETIEQLKLQIGQLTKQCTDLQVVNKKLLSEVKHQILTKGKSELIPLKITRSVGLQVKSSVDPSKKKTIVTQSPKPQVVPIKARSQVQSIAVRPVLPKLSTPTNSNVPSTPLLSHALQTRKRPSVSPSVQKRVTPIGNGRAAAVKPKLNVIDLTDEDEKTKTPVSSPLGVTYKTVPLKAVVSAANFSKAMRQNKAVMKNGSTITLPANMITTGGGTSQLMYVVQPPGSLPQGIMTTTSGGAQKTVIVNFQPTNGVISPTIPNSNLSLMSKTSTSSSPVTAKLKKHPAPLPMPPSVKIAMESSLKPLPPKPHLSIRKTDTGIVLQWKMPYKLEIYESIASYQLYAYQETNAPPSTDMWRKVGDVKALALPMACTLTQFADKNRYYFAVRSVDVHKRIGPFSDPEEISL